MLVCKNADNTIRWKEGERLNHLFEQRCDQLHSSSNGSHPAVVTDDAVFTFRDLDNRANQVARFLIDQGLKSGDRVGLMFDKTVDTYVALLAVLKINAAYVPLDAGFPKERIAFILQDAGVKAIVSLSLFRPKLSEFPVPLVFLDVAEREINEKKSVRLADGEKSAPVDQLCYIIYTSGTTGTPKGVAIEHPSICNFVKVAAEVYGIREGDRAYQGMTIAFDFSVEELWVPLIAGAALVPGKPGTSLVGSDLAEFLLERHVTYLACVPTLLATIETDLPELRILLVSGEACPHNLVVRWHRAGRTILNAYGPTEATVTATLTELYPDKPVTIGGPLPTYTIVILDADEDKAVENGGLGEIGIAGIGLAAGYLNRADLTQKKFIPDFLNIANNPSKRIYRTGDLGRINDQGEVEFHGRIDTQVKIRGYRIELTEIESVLMQLPQIAQAVVDVYEPEPGAVELVAYYSLKQGASALSLSDVSQTLRKHLPGYMVPAYFEELPVIPMTSSHKADRKNLPPPKGPRFSAGSSNFVAPRTETEEALARALVEVMKIERVSVVDNFFQDLGAHSLLMARFGAEIRKRLNVSAVSMRDIYLNPTIEKLAQHLNASPDEAIVQAPPRDPLRIPSDFEYFSCGTLQLLYYVASAVFGFWLLTVGFWWTYAAIDNTAEAYLRVVAFSIASFVLLNAVPIALKWLLIGKWKEEVIPIWSLRYFRFWLVKNLTRSAPMAQFIGTPMYNVYLRLLGAKIGRNTVIESTLLPVCTDLISIGDNTIVRRDSAILGYRAQSNYIYTGSISIGDNVFVGEASILDINTAMEDDTQLGHASSLQVGQRVPKGKHYHGSPAQETTADYCSVEPKKCTSLRRWLYSGVQIAVASVIVSPLVILLVYHVFPYVYHATSAHLLDHNAPGPALLLLALEMMVGSLVLFFGALVVGFLAVILIPRVLYAFLQEGRTYVLYGVHYFIYRIIARVSNSPIYCMIFGDSAFIVYYLRWVGYRLNTIVQTGSNFGLDQRHDVPFLCDIGSGTMVSDGLTMINAPMSNSAFKLSTVKIGDHNYMGNRIYYPAEGKTGPNCLLGTKVMIPVDGPVRENVGLLGSPCFEIPRVVDRDKHLNPDVDDKTRRQQIRAKTRYNVVTMIAFLLTTWLFVYVALLSLYVALLYFPLYGAVALFAYGVIFFVWAILWFSFLEKACLGFKKLTPKLVSMYDKRFWQHERYWKFTGSPLGDLFKGTPFKNIISRLLGVKVGKRVFDDGCRFYDKGLIEVGDYTNLNESCVIQGHSLEEGVFKCDYIKIGSGCTLGCAAFVHYGVTIGDNVVLDPDSFLMKGEILDPNTTWRGNPAKRIGVKEAARGAAFRRRGLFRKYAASLVGLVVFVLAVNGSLETWSMYRETTQLLVKTQSEKAEATARRIEQFVSEIERQISWATRASASTVEQRSADYALLLQQVPAIDRVIHLDSDGREQLRLVRGGVVVASGVDYSGDSRFKETQSRSVWLSPVYFDGLDPFMTIAMQHSGRNAGSTVAEINLKFLSNFIDPDQIGKDNDAYIVSPAGRLLAHSENDRRLGTDLRDLPQVAAMTAGDEPLTFGQAQDGRSVLTASAAIAGMNWYVFFEQPLSTALQPVYGLLYRTGWLLALGVLLAVFVGTLLARQMVVPIRALQVGARQLEASDFGHRIEVRTGDEVQDLAERFNRMADQLQGSYSRLEQKVAERTRDLAQSVSELKALEEIGRAVASSLDSKSVLATIVTRAVELARADAGAIYSFDASREVFELAEAHALDRSFQDSVRAIRIKLNESVLGLSAQKREPICIPDLAKAPDYPLRDLTLSAGFNSVLVVPLLGQNEILGALVVQRRAVGDFPASTIGLMQTFAHQSVLAMNNARLFREVEQKGRELAIANDHKAQFFANMSHELRTPLNGVLGFAELLADGLYGQLPDKALEVLELLQKDGKHLLGLINDVLDISKIDAGQLTLALNDYSLQMVVEAVVASTGSLAQAKAIEVKAVIPPDLPIGRGDERRLTQVLLNIVGNAIKFTDTGSVEIRVNAANGHYAIAVQDTGPGIPPEDQARIFEEFQQVDNSITRQKGGTGLGLSIARRLVDAHGGRIDLQSTPGVGTTFNIVLPVRVTEQRQPA